MTALSELAAQYWFVLGVGVSYLWFAAGKQSLPKKGPGAAIGWQVIAVIIALIVCGRSVVERQWLGAVLGIITALLEVRSIKRFTLHRPPQ
jgi:hypothetical protein